MSKECFCFCSSGAGYDCKAVSGSNVGNIDNGKK